MNNLKITHIFAVVISLTASMMLSSLTLAAAAPKDDCEKGGGKWVARGDKGDGFCYTTLEPEHCTMPRIEVPDPEFCGISTDPTPTPSACTPTEGATNTTAGRGGAAGLVENQSTTSEVRMQIEEACLAAKNGDIQGVLMKLNSALNVLEGSNSTQGSNITNATAKAGVPTTNATTTNATTTTAAGKNTTEDVNPSTNQTSSRMEGPGDPTKGLKTGVTETPAEQEGGGASSSSNQGDSGGTTTTTETDNQDNGGSDGGDNSASIVVSDDGGPQGPKDTKSCGRCLGG
jgi:hypothetical protein